MSPSSGDFLSQFETHLGTLETIGSKSQSNFASGTAQGGTPDPSTGGISGAILGAAGAGMGGLGALAGGVASQLSPADSFAGLFSRRIIAIILGLLLIAGALFLFGAEEIFQNVNGVVKKIGAVAA
jgi:hypothetical protein